VNSKLSSYNPGVAVPWQPVVDFLVLASVFQPELRHTFMRLDAILRPSPRTHTDPSSTHRTIAEATFELAHSRTGALLVVARGDVITELVQGGIRLGATVSRELLAAIFQKSSPLHDGAVIVRGDSAALANGVLPLTLRRDVPSQFGTRHRAGMGLAERSDALVIVVSEERGTVTLMRDSAFHEVSNPEDLAGLLGRFDRRTDLTAWQRIWASTRANLRLKVAAAALAAVVWAFTFLAPGSSIRTIRVPVEFVGVPRGTDVTEQSAAELAVQLRGNPLVIDSGSVRGMVARFDLRGTQPGLLTFQVDPRTLDLPPGVRLERAAPRTVSVRLVRR
jgi:DNA integrity scanning protein DisA with diadenylate cyclase activity